MATTPTFVAAYTDSVAKSILEFSTAFVSNTAIGSPSSSTIIAGVSGPGANNTYGRVALTGDGPTELALLFATNASVNNVIAYITGLQSLNGFYQQYYTIFNALDLAVSGLNAFLTTSGLQVSSWFAQAFNAWCSVATQVTSGRNSSNTPVVITPGNYFPGSAIDTIWNITTGAGTVMSSSLVGANANSSIGGGGVGQIVIYKSNTGNAVGGASLVITYKNGSGANVTATYATVAGTPVGSGSLAAAYIVTNAIGSQIISVTGTGMTAAEQYTFGIQPIRTIAY